MLISAIEGVVIAYLNDLPHPDLVAFFQRFAKSGELGIVLAALQEAVALIEGSLPVSPVPSAPASNPV